VPCTWVGRRDPSQVPWPRPIPMGPFVEAFLAATLVVGLAEIRDNATRHGWADPQARAVLPASSRTIKPAASSSPFVAGSDPDMNISKAARAHTAASRTETMMV